MSYFFYFEDGYYYLTGAGTALMAALAASALILAVLVLGKKESVGRGKVFSIKTLTFSAMAMALAFVTSYIKVFSLPYGGSVTLFSMLFICLIGYWYGPRAGILTGLSYSILQFLQEPYILTPLQVCLDYFFAFSALGLSGFFRNRKNGLVIGYLAGAFARGLCHIIGGYLFWMAYMPDNFPKAFTKVYPIVYNYSYIGLEAAVTVIVLFVPAVKKAMERVKTLACS